MSVNDLLILLNELKERGKMRSLRNEFNNSMIQEHEC